MKPAPFDYLAPGSVPEAVAALAEHGPEAAVLAGGQSLLIDLRYRRRRPALLVDINRIATLSQITTGTGAIHIGALVRHADLERAGFSDPLAELFRRVAPHVAHPPIRARGTFAGSLAWAHPAAEWGALAAALGAEVELSGPAGSRQVPARLWFRGAFTTARQPDELVTGVRLPLLAPDTVVRFAEHRRTHGSFALAAAVVAIRIGRGAEVGGGVIGRGAEVGGEITAEGRVEWARIGLANAAEVPLRALAAEEVLLGQRPTPELLREAAAQASAEADPIGEPYASVAYRRHVLKVLVRRCLTEAVEETWTSS
jgi:carbon-monoxide dehydrogenase medium subunit